MEYSTIPDYAPTVPWIQEVAPNGAIVAEFRSWEQFSAEDTQDPYLGQAGIFHTNAVEVDTDGNWLLSSRNLSEITKVDRETGEVLWRMGGKENEFTLVGDNRWFSHQHDIRRLPNGHISLFDNGVLSNPVYSRYLEYEIDEDSVIITKTREIRHLPDVYAAIMGSSRTLPNGNVLIGWGNSSQPAVTEYDQRNRKTFELSFPDPLSTYRAYPLAQWHGKPVEPPTVVEDGGVLYFSWNGSTDVAGYQIYGGQSEPTNYMGSVIKTGFEQSHLMQDGYCTYQVVAVGKNGKVLAKTFHRAQACGVAYFPLIGGN